MKVGNALQLCAVHHTSVSPDVMQTTMKWHTCNAGVNAGPLRYQGRRCAMAAATGLVASGRNAPVFSNMR